MSDKRLLKSYVWHGDRCYFVSTIERDSSAQVVPPSRYNETIAWEYDWDSQERGDMVAMEGEGAACRQHFAVCRSLFTTGKYDPDLSELFSATSEKGGGDETT